MKLKIATYNIHKGVTGGALRIHDIREALSGLDADLLFLQEIQGQNNTHAQKFDNWPTQSQIDYIAENQYPYFAYGRNVVKVHRDHGNALFSRYPIVSHNNIDVSDHPLESRGLLHCVIDYEGVLVHAFVVHLGLFAASRRRQVAALKQRILEAVPMDAPVIVAGDFNDWQGRLCASLQQDIGLVEAFSSLPQSTGERSHSPVLPSMIAQVTEKLQELGVKTPWIEKIGQVADALEENAVTGPARSFPSAFPLLRLDRVYIRHFTVSHADVRRGEPWKTLSDHAPLTVDLFAALGASEGAPVRG